MPEQRLSLADLLKQLQVEQRSSQIVPADIAAADSDEKRLRLLERHGEQHSSNALAPKFDPVIEKLSFTACELAGDDRDAAWCRFVAGRASLDPPTTWAVARWYRERGLLQHAASVFEDLHGSAYPDSGFPLDYVIEMMDLYQTLGESQRVHDLLKDIKQVLGTGGVDFELLVSALKVSQEAAGVELEREEALLLYSSMQKAYADLLNEFTNARYELALRESGVRIGEATHAASEWLETQYGELWKKLEEECKSALRDAVAWSRVPDLRDTFYWCIPVACQKAVEAKFESDVFRLVRDHWRADLPKRYERPLSINQIHDLLAYPDGGTPDHQRDKRKVLPLIREILGTTDLRPHLHRLRLLKDRSTQARHGGSGERRYSLDHALTFGNAIGLTETNGWLFAFLAALQPPKGEKR